MLKETWKMSWPEYLFKIISEAPLTYISALFFFFIALFLIIYCLLRTQRAKRNAILVGNVIFYIWSGWSAGVIVLFTGITAYFSARKMAKIYSPLEDTADLTPKEKAAKANSLKKYARIPLILSILLIAGYWIAVKIAGLTGFESVKTFPEMLNAKAIIVPLGISYYTLSSVGYLLDVYWRKAKAERNFITYFTVMTYFPHIVQGPIGKYQELHRQMNALPKFDYDRVCKGLQLACWGYFKKMVVADRLNMFTSTIFTNPTDYAGVEIVIAVIFGSIQLYTDFSGCMDIVKGISQVLGIGLADNFRQPFFAKTAAEFWNRWHITLGAWTKDYLYMPIAVHPKFLKLCANLRKKSPWLSSFLKSFIPSVLVWLFTGFWHGTGLDYIVWGLYWCALITLGKETAPLVNKLFKALKIDRERKYYRVIQTLKIFVLFSIGRMFTVAGGLEQCRLLWERIFFESRLWKLFDDSMFTHGLDRKDFYVAIICIILLIIVDIFHEKKISIREKVTGLPIIIRWILYYGLIFSVIIFGVYGPGFNAADFVYGNF